MIPPRRPRALRPGDRIALTAPSSGVAEASWPQLDACIARLTARGFDVVAGETLRRQSKQCSAPARERAAELQAILLDPGIAAVLPPWGGERAIELLPWLDFETLSGAPPKWFSGFSDLSTLQLPLCLRAGWMSLHGPNLMQLGATDLDLVTGAIWNVLENDTAPVQRTTRPWRRLDGEATPLALRGRLIGGCLDTLSRLAGTPFGDVGAWAAQPGMAPTLVFLENAELSPCELLRALWSLRLHGWFDNAAGVVMGRHAAPDAEDAALVQHEDAVRSALGDLGLPVLLDADIGHVPPQLSLIQGEWAGLHWAPGSLEMHLGPSI